MTDTYNNIEKDPEPKQALTAPDGGHVYEEYWGCDCGRECQEPGAEPHCRARRVTRMLTACALMPDQACPSDCQSADRGRAGHCANALRNAAGGCASKRTVRAVVEAALLDCWDDGQELSELASMRPLAQRHAGTIMAALRDALRENPGMIHELVLA